MALATQSNDGNTTNVIDSNIGGDRRDDDDRDNDRDHDYCDRLDDDNGCATANTKTLKRVTTTVTTNGNNGDD